MLIAASGRGSSQRTNGGADHPRLLVLSPVARSQETKGRPWSIDLTTRPNGILPRLRARQERPTTIEPQQHSHFPVDYSRGECSHPFVYLTLCLTRRTENPVVAPGAVGVSGERGHGDECAPFVACASALYRHSAGSDETSDLYIVV